MSCAANQLALDDVLAVSRSGALDDRSITLVDVRGRDEYAAGHIKGAHNLPVQELPAALTLDPRAFEAQYGFALPASDSDNGLAVYCQRGTRTQAAAAHLANAHYKDNLFLYLPGWAEYSASAATANDRE
ncbi:Thiosulfate sulfurtransferase rdl2, mitochondrial [Coemansia biformis]|uniref:Thiosulfate sulfurtransferase rdl2, mitochondrial n=1 Tax=Coemansia biformis TaxID=1286918 RepID=A0A9W7XYV2_9FUNG|nr:Thiosulfate sulfurtransferase rdl2, mitochondrial [Coemansia biformis]